MPKLVCFNCWQNVYVGERSELYFKILNTSLKEGIEYINATFESGLNLLVFTRLSSS